MPKRSERQTPSRGWISVWSRLFLRLLLGVSCQYMAEPASAVGPKTPVMAGKDHAVPDRYIVRLNDAMLPGKTHPRHARTAEIDKTAQKLMGRYGGKLHARWAHAMAGFAVEMSAAEAALLADDPRVASVEQDQLVVAHGSPVPGSWGLDRLDQRDLPLDSVYEPMITGQNGVTVYILDSGIRTTHADFSGRAQWGANFTGDGIDTDCSGHGTHVAGIVAGATYGVAKSANLVAVKVLNCAGNGSVSAAISGIDWVMANRHAPAVMNLSLGLPKVDQNFNNAIANAVDEGITVVVSAGNDNTDACSQSPASAPAGLTVGATDQADHRSSFSNWGYCLDMFAPGSNILSASGSSDTAITQLSGTSQAAPHVAGAAALYLGGHPFAAPQEVSMALSGNATLGRVADAGSGSLNQLLYAGETTQYGVFIHADGLGKVISVPNGIDCGAVCRANFPIGAPLDLTAIPANGYRFTGWSGACTGLDKCHIALAKPIGVTASFQYQYGLPEIFPSMGNIPPGWDTPPDSNAAWRVVAYPTTEGGYSMQSGVITDSQVSALDYTDDFAEGTVSFDWRVSSETRGDWLAFSVDDQVVDRLSGCPPLNSDCWRSVAVSLTAGRHTLRWSYEKDFSIAIGADAAWLDNVRLPRSLAKGEQNPLSIGADSLSLAVGGATKLSVTGGSGMGEVSYAAVGTAGLNCHLLGDRLTASGLPGSCSVTATKAADAEFNAITSMPLPVSVGPADVQPGLLAAVLPYARSVQLGQAATAFGTIINNTSSAAIGCRLAMPDTLVLPASFNYQTTNPANALTGAPNTPIDIPAGGIQGFVFGVTPALSFDAADIPIQFTCENRIPAPSQPGLNTFLLSASSAAVPDMVAIGVTATGDGILHIPGTSGVNVFATAAINIGVTGSIIVTADTGNASLPLILSLCQTEPVTGACLTAPADHATVEVQNNQTVTFSVFAQAMGVIPFNPANSRVFLRLASDSMIRGATSVAVSTE